ncbi:MAG: hypothetical protein AVDCRST_MAG49-2015 [uncultured Thermomicrobiales bacterium]|uniref:Uncharacterized protein n=1 Tax=uncultured Thermomicrobiales bacterium TaxID=1645740 RepID=A0A6J4UMI1_9BACT|nr:MAG: hypothetical protein AVDCRST_MAG49-2015 [uncultured Thermomicrobiales bacterium]
MDSLGLSRGNATCQPYPTGVTDEGRTFVAIHGICLDVVDVPQAERGTS